MESVSSSLLRNPSRPNSDESHRTQPKPSASKTPNSTPKKDQVTPNGISGQALTQENLARHNHNQAQRRPGGTGNEVRGVQTAKVGEADQSPGVASGLGLERTMQNSQAATTMEWFLAEEDRARIARSFPRG